MLGRVWHFSSHKKCPFTCYFIAFLSVFGIKLLIIYGAFLIIFNQIFMKTQFFVIYLYSKLPFCK